MREMNFNEWQAANKQFNEEVDACFNSDEFKTWLAGLNDKCKHCTVADGRFSDDEFTRKRSLHACNTNCPKVLVSSYWNEQGIV